jgi:hypothetical protein
MNPVNKIISTLLGTISGLINSIDTQTVNIIRQIFFIVIFALCVTGIYMGYSSGREAAQIKSPPLAESTKDLFQLDRKMEREEARFGSMLESEQLNEIKYSDRAKIEFPSRHDMVPEKREGIFEPERSIKPRRGLETDEGRSIVEGDYSGTGRSKPEVSPLDKKLKPVEPEIIKQKENDIRVKGLREEKRGQVKGPEKDIRTPSPINIDHGIIEK